MYSTQCPHCHKFTPSDRADCLACGRSLHAPHDNPPRQGANVKVPLACPKCGSQQLTADKAGFGIGKAVVGGVLLGGVGLLGGFLGSRKVRVSCLECGHSWEAGQRK